MEKERDSMKASINKILPSSTASPSLSQLSRNDLRDDPEFDSLPTSTDDVMMSHIEHANHPSLLNGPPSTSSRLKQDARDAGAAISDKASQLRSRAEDKLDNLRSSSNSSSVVVEEPLPHYMQPSDTHPLATSMRDAWTHPGLTSLATHDTEKYSAVGAASGAGHRSDVHQHALDAAAARYDVVHEPKEHSAGLIGALHSLNEKLEHGAEMIRDKADAMIHPHSSTSAVKTDDYERFGGTVPTLIDKSNPTNAAIVQSRLHPAADRAGQHPMDR